MSPYYFQAANLWNVGLKPDRSPLPARPMLERKQSPQPRSKDESVPFGRDPIPGPIGGGAIRQRHSQLLQLRSVRCRNTAMIRKAVPQLRAAWPEVAAERARSASPQNRIPSGPGPCESTPGESEPARSSLRAALGLISVGASILVSPLSFHAPCGANETHSEA